ncbi:MAG TPA: alginate lyase family protein [Verrucomicrobiae bacterium]|nr:alginate lyase family protein [Verrucomicrobiae bacterium]
MSFLIRLRRPLFILLTAFAARALCAADASTITRLDEHWEYHQGGLGSVWEIWRGEKASDNVAWTPVTLPHCFNARDAVDPDGHYYQGPGWYRTLLAVTNPFPDGRVLLHFDGAGQKSQVFVGLEKVGEHLGGYDEWEVDITDAVRRATNHIDLAVECDNSRDAESIPSDLSDFMRYGGLYRHVSLRCVPAISLARVHVKPTLGDTGAAAIKIEARLYNPAAASGSVQLALNVTDPSGKLVYTTNFSTAAWTGAKEIAACAIAAPQRWSPRTPLLYHCSVKFTDSNGAQEMSEPFGLRSLEWVEHGPFKLNGERLLLRGTQYHQDHAGVGAAVPDDVTRDTFRQIKNMGANFVRLAHYQQSPLVLQLCDELGLLVWEEIPWCRGGLGGERYQQQGRDMLTAMIDQHFNHPSVIMWGLGNENGWPGDFPVFDQTAIRAYMTSLNQLAHELDPSRQTCIRYCNFCTDIPDVYSPSVWAGWYSGRYREYRGALEREIKAVPHFFHAEWGGDSHAGRFSEDPEAFLHDVATGRGAAETAGAYKTTGGRARAAKDGDWSESYIANLFDWHLKEQEQMTNLTGTAQWLIKDFATPLRPENPVPYVNQKGVLERDGAPKESFYIFQSYWAEQPMLHIFGHGWPVRWGRPDEEKEVKVFSNCREVELFVNGVSAGVKQRRVADFPAAGLHWMVKFHEGTNTLRAVAGGLTDEINVGYETNSWGKPATLTLRSIGPATVEARAVDQYGAPCLDAMNTVRFGVSGDAELMDDLGTAAGSRVVQLANGRARISLRFTGARAVASVQSAGLPTQFLFLTNPPPVSIDVGALDRTRILKAADAALTLDPPAVTKSRAPLSEGGPHDFYSNGDYWWPDPTKTNGLPYLEHDGDSNPNNFSAHRLAIRELRDAVAALGAAYKITGDNRYAAKAAELLRVFFLDPATRMNPSLQYAQAVPGRNSGRSWGIIDGLHLIEIPPAVTALQSSPAFSPELVAGLKKWFRDLADWMVTSKNGRAEGAAKNNHAVAYYLQVAVFARFSGDEDKLDLCRRQFKEVLIPNQMAADGSFPAELKRTKPYGYSIFQLDNMAMLCQTLSTPADNLWNFTLPDGRGLGLAVKYLYPFLADKSTWPLKPDLQAWNDWPARQPSLLFAGLAFHQPDYVALWQRLPADPANAEVRRNIPITQPLLWLSF